MDKRFALVAVWSLFAGASVGVGFGAAGLVGGPFATPGLESEASSVEGDVLRSQLLPEALQTPTTAVPPDEPSGSSDGPRPETTKAGSQDADGASGRPAGATSTGSVGTGRTSHAQTPATRATSASRSPSEPSRSPAAPRAGSGERDIQTRGGYVRASCTDGSLSVAASPAVGWTLDHIEKEAAGFAEVRFLQVGGASGRVDVEARCTAQGATLVVVKDENGSSGPDGGDDDD